MREVSLRRTDVSELLEQSPSEVPINVWEWRAIEEGEALLRELGAREAVLEPQSTGPGGTVFTEELGERLIQWGPRG